MSKKILITGATGLIGLKLCKMLIGRGDHLTIFTRDLQKAKKEISGAREYVSWNYNIPGEWSGCINGKDAVIHLAGASIAGKRWNKEYKDIIMESREKSTRSLVNAIEQAAQKPSSFISSSAVGYYGNSGNTILTEDSDNRNDFLSNVCKVWEEEAEKVERLGVRRVSVRTGIVLSKDGGALKQMLPAFRFFAGGPLGNGRQWFPWIHIDDLIRIYIYALDNSSVSGSINAAAVNPITMKEFAKKLGKTLHRPAIIPVPLFALKMAIGESAKAVVASQRVVPEKLLRGGFKFKFENAEDALRDLLL